MDNTIAKLLDLFKHISRDIIIYAISGFVVIVNFFIIDKFYLGGIYFGLIDKLEYISLIIFILSYVIGHIIMSLMQIVDFIERQIGIQDIGSIGFVLLGQKERMALWQSRRGS